MKTHEFARHLELLAKLLRQLPNTELDSTRSQLRGLIPGIDEGKDESPRTRRELPTGFETRLTSMSPAEIEAFLLSDEEAFTVANLSELADRLGLTSSKRQSKSALVNMITRHYEASKMHEIMRGTKPNEA